MGGTCSVVGDVKGKGNELFKAGKFEEAIEVYTRALDADPKDHTVYSNRSAARMKLSQYGFAITDALSCVALAPTWPKGYYRLGSALAAIKKHGEAADNLRKALALSPDDPAIRSSLEDVVKAAAKEGGAVGRGYVYTWGAREATGRADGSVTSGGFCGGSSSTPKMLEGAMGRQVVDVACGLQHTVLVTSVGEVLSWGSNRYGQCGTSSKDEVVNSPTYVAGLFGHRCVSVACGGAHTFVVSDEGRTFSWGQGSCGQLGQGHKRAVIASPAQVSTLADKQVRGVACGFGHTVIVLAGGECLTCGWNNAGQCGQGSTSDVLTPTQVPKLKGQWSSIQHASAGGGHTAVVTFGGALLTFGSGSCGQLGLGSTEDSVEPQQVQGVLKGVHVSAVACGEEFTVCVSRERSVVVFGLNNVGQLGGASSNDCECDPVQLDAIGGRNVELCCCTQGQTLGLTADGAVWEWGRGVLGGGGEGGSGVLTPQQVQALLRGEDPMAGGISKTRAGGGGGGSGVKADPPRELAWFSKRAVERIECGRRHFCVLLRGTHAPSCVATGKGLAAAVAGRKEKIKIQAVAADGDKMTQGGDRFEALVFTDEGDVVAAVHVDDGMDGTYECEYICSKAGVCSLWIRLGGSHIQGSPFRVEVAPQEPSLELSSLSAVCSLAHGYHRAGEELVVWVYIRDKYGNPCAVALADLEVRVSVENTEHDAEHDAALGVEHKLELDSKTATPLVLCTPTLSGTCTVAVSLKERGALRGSGLEVTVVSAAADVRKSKAAGTGMDGAEAGVFAEFHVTLHDEFGNKAEMFRHGYKQEFVEPADVPLEIMLHQMMPGGGRGKAVEVTTLSCGILYGAAHQKSTFSVGYTVLDTVPLLLQLRVAGRDLFPAAQMIKVRAGPSSALYSVVSGGGIESGSLRGGTLTKTLNIEARDEYDNPRGVGGDAFKVELALEGGGTVSGEVKDARNDGVYVCSYTVTKAGRHTLSILLDDVHVAASPYPVHVSPDPAEEVRRRHKEQEALIQRHKEAAEKRKLADARRREAAAAAAREREDLNAKALQLEAEARAEKEAKAVEMRAAEAAAKEEEKRRKLMQRLRREEETRRRAVALEEEKRLGTLEKLKVADDKRCRPGSAVKRAGGGFVLSFSGDGDGARATGRKDAWQ